MGALLAHLSTCPDTRPKGTGATGLDRCPMVPQSSCPHWFMQPPRVGALGPEVHQSLGVTPTIDTAGEKNEFNLLSSLIFHYYKNKYTSAQRREMASSMHMPPGGSPHSSPQPSLSAPPGGGGAGGVDRVVIFHLQPQLIQPHTPGHTVQEPANNRNTPNAPGRTLPRPGHMPPPCQRQQQQRAKCGHPDPEAKLVLTP